MDEGEACLHKIISSHQEKAKGAFIGVGRSMGRVFLFSLEKLDFLQVSSRNLDENVGLMWSFHLLYIYIKALYEHH